MLRAVDIVKFCTAFKESAPQEVGLKAAIFQRHTPCLIPGVPPTSLNQPSPITVLPPQALPKVHAIVYASRCADPSPPYGLLRTIRAEAEPANASRGIRSALSLQDGWFLHWLEADHADTLRQLMRRIERDRRHTDVQVLFDAPAWRSAIDSWSMTINNRGEHQTEMLGRAFRAAERHAAGELRTPRAAWRAFASDTRVGARQSAPAPVKRVWIVSATTGLAQDIVTAWAAAHGNHASSSRLMGSLALATDFSGASADVTWSGGVLRMIGIARRALGLGLLQELMRDADAIVIPTLGHLPADMSALLATVQRIVALARRRTPVLLCGDSLSPQEISDTLGVAASLHLDAQWATLSLGATSQAGDAICSSLAQIWHQRATAAEHDRAVLTTQPIALAPAPPPPGIHVGGVRVAVAVDLSLEAVVGQRFGDLASAPGVDSLTQEAEMVRALANFSRELQGHESLHMAGTNSRMLRLSPWGRMGCCVQFDEQKTDINDLRRSVSAYLAWLEVANQRKGA
jgi:hypothetical protein